jgi:hypothetical protein
MKTTLSILWPSLLFGGLGAIVFFSLHDPVDLSFIGPLEFGRKAGYIVGFLIFWGFAAGSSGLTWFLERWHARR